MVTWDEAKRRQNIAKHGVDLADAERFDFDNAIVDEDRDERKEQRFRAVGWLDGRLAYFVFTIREEEIYAISRSKAEPKERRRYFRLSPAHQR